MTCSFMDQVSQLLKEQLEPLYNKIDKMNELILKLQVEIRQCTSGSVVCEKCGHMQARKNAVNSTSEPVPRTGNSEPLGETAENDSRILQGAFRAQTPTPCGVKPPACVQKIAYVNVENDKAKDEGTCQDKTEDPSDLYMAMNVGSGSQSPINENDEQLYIRNGTTDGNKDGEAVLRDYDAYSNRRRCHTLPAPCSINIRGGEYVHLSKSCPISDFKVSNNHENRPSERCSEVPRYAAPGQTEIKGSNKSMSLDRFTSLKNCALCELVAVVDIKGIIDSLGSEDIIQGELYNRLAFSQQPVGKQGRLWKDLICALNCLGCSETGQVMVNMENYLEKHHPGLAARLKELFETSKKKLRCRCIQRSTTL